MVNSLYWLSFMLVPMISQASSILWACSLQPVAMPESRTMVKSTLFITCFYICFIVYGLLS